ncbi:MAG: hypothetical protein HOQ24_12250 [Mycobacteriaceae bacterium]|nr:hypothetical protein [Mycobacteriaceae bacterium]
MTGSARRIALWAVGCAVVAAGAAGCGDGDTTGTVSHTVSHTGVDAGPAASTPAQSDAGTPDVPGGAPGAPEGSTGKAYPNPVDLGEFRFGGGPSVYYVRDTLANDARKRCYGELCVNFLIAEQAPKDPDSLDCGPTDFLFLRTSPDFTGPNGHLVVRTKRGALGTVTIYGVRCKNGTPVTGPATSSTTKPRVTTSTSTTAPTTHARPS